MVAGLILATSFFQIYIAVQFIDYSQKCPGQIQLDQRNLGKFFLRCSVNKFAKGYSKRNQGRSTGGRNRLINSGYVKIVCIARPEKLVHSTYCHISQ